MLRRASLTSRYRRVVWKWLRRRTPGDAAWDAAPRASGRRARSQRWCCWEPSAGRDSDATAL